MGQLGSMIGLEAGAESVIHLKQRLGGQGGPFGDKVARPTPVDPSNCGRLERQVRAVD